MQQPEYYSYILDSIHADPFQQDPGSEYNVVVDDNGNPSTSMADAPLSRNDTVMARQGYQFEQPSYQFAQQQQRLHTDTSRAKMMSTDGNFGNNRSLLQGNSSINTAIATTDFRRRKNWSERILVEIAGLLHVLSTTGKFLYCSESTYELTGYRPHELVGQTLLDFIHVDDMDVFIRDFQMAFHTRSKIRTYYRFRKKDDSYVIFEVVGQPQKCNTSTKGQLQAPTSFFAIAQPIPTKNGGLMDTFLELKAENMWLNERITELKAQQQKGLEPNSKHHNSDHTNLGQQTSSADNLKEPFKSRVTPRETTYVHKNGRGASNGLLNIGNGRTFKDDYPSHTAHWMDESDPLISDDLTGVKNTAVSQNNASIPLPRSSRNTGVGTIAEEKKVQWKRRKKQKGPDEYVCADCGTTSSPEWRKGPQGPKSLCNACGLRWAKKNKQEQI